MSKSQKSNQMNSYFELSKQEIVKDLKELIVEIESKNEAEFNNHVNNYKCEEDPGLVALCRMFYINDSIANKYLKSLF